MKTLAHNPLRIAHKSLACILTFCIVNMPLWAIVDGDVVGTPTNATVSITDNVLTDVVLSDSSAIINWSNLDTMNGEDLNYTYDSGSFAVLNRVAQRVDFNGNLNAMGGHVFIMSPNGVIIGSTANINATQFTASGLDMADQDFLNGNHQFQPFVQDQAFEGIDGGMGDVKNYASISAEQVSLIGKNVTNKGVISADGYAIMAAGETVFISENGSDVAVEVAMPDGWTSGSGIGEVKNNGTDNGDGIYGKHIILAAGDIESSAYINATDSASSDAVATVLIDAKGDVRIEGDVTAEAFGDGEFNATATITINAGDDVKIDSDGSSSTDVKAKAEDGLENLAEIIIEAGGDVELLAQNGDAELYAEADSDCYDGELNEANIKITGANVEILSEDNGSGGSDDALVKAWAKDADENVANIEITATGTEVIEEDVVVDIDGGDVIIESERRDGDNATISAKAEQGTTNTATIEIDAADDVRIISDEDDAVVKAEALNDLDEDDLVDGAIAGLSNTATIDITAVDEVEITAENSSSADAAVEAVAKNIIDIDPVSLTEPEPDTEDPATADVTIQNLTNTATINITGGSVDVKGLAGDSSPEAAVTATAANEMKLDIDNWDDEAEVNITVDGLQNNASVAIAANGEVCETNVEIEGDDGYALVRAEAYNELEVEHKGYSSRGSYTPVAPATVNLTVENLTNNANVDISSVNGSVVVRADEGYGKKDWNPYTAGVEAEAYNVFTVEFDETTTGGLSVDKLDNNAGITITAADDVKILAEDGGRSEVIAEAYNVLTGDAGEADIDVTAEFVTNDAAVVVTAVDGVVEIEAECHGDCSETGIVALAYNEGEGFEELGIMDLPETMFNVATVDIVAGDDVKVIGEDCGTAYIIAETWMATENISAITINTTDGDVLVIGKNGDAEIFACAFEGVDNSAAVAIDAVGGDVKVIDIGEGGEKSAHIEAVAKGAFNSNTADVSVNATAVATTYEDDGKEWTEVEGGDVKVIAIDGGDAAITAYAADSGGPETNTANVRIDATGVDLVGVEQVDCDVFVSVDNGDSFTEGGNVEVSAEGCGSDAEIEAIAKQGETNVANVLICVENVLVEGDRGGEAEIEAIAKQGYSNTATVGIGARGDEGVGVLAQRGGEASIGTKAKQGYMNTASTIVCTQGGIDVLARDGGDAGILAEAKEGAIADAYVGVCAQDDIIVQAGTEPEPGCDALIRSEAEACETADAETVAVSHTGNVEVLAYNGGEALIGSEAHGAHINTANTGVAAGADLSPSDVLIPEPDFSSEFLTSPGDFELEFSQYSTGNVIVRAMGRGSRAGIVAKAYDASPNFEFPDIPDTLEVQKTEVEPIIIPGENSADVVVCAPGEVVVVSGKGKENPPAARIRAVAGEYEGESDTIINSASTQVYASDVYVSRGARIAAVAGDDQKFVGGNIEYCLLMDGAIGLTDGDSILIIDDYSNRKDCPTCPPCPCEEGGLSVPPVPLPLLEIPRLAGCPAVMDAAADELAVNSDQLQFMIANAMATNPNLQPCTACENLLQAASALKGINPEMMAAMNQIFNNLAPSDAPFTPEVSASIQTAFADFREMEPQLASMSEEEYQQYQQYAMADEVVEAFVSYVAVLDNDLKLPVGDAMALVMQKYFEPIETSENPNIGSFLIGQMEGARVVTQ